MQWLGGVIIIGLGFVYPLFGVILLGIFVIYWMMLHKAIKDDLNHED